MSLIMQIINTFCVYNRFNFIIGFDKILKLFQYPGGYLCIALFLRVNIDVIALMNYLFLWSINDDPSLILQERKWDYKSVHTKCIKNIPQRIFMRWS